MFHALRQSRSSPIPARSAPKRRRPILPDPFRNHDETDLIATCCGNPFVSAARRFRLKSEALPATHARLHDEPVRTSAATTIRRTNSVSKWRLYLLYNNHLRLPVSTAVAARLGFRRRLRASPNADGTLRIVKELAGLISFPDFPFRTGRHAFGSAHYYRPIVGRDASFGRENPRESARSPRSSLLGQAAKLALPAGSALRNLLDIS